MVKDADPTNPDAFCPCGQPEVLDGTTGAVQVCLSHRGTAQDMSASTLTTAGYTDIDRRFLDTFELEAPIEIRASTGIPHRCLFIRLEEQLLHSPLRGTLPDDHKVPRLHKSDRPGVMGCRQNPRKHIVRDRLPQKIAADIPSLKNHTIDRVPLMVGELSAAGTFHILTHRHDDSVDSACVGADGLRETSPTSPAPTFVRHVGHKQS
jgi:hypothetical protein